MRGPGLQPWLKGSKLETSPEIRRALKRFYSCFFFWRMSICFKLQGGKLSYETLSDFRVTTWLNLPRTTQSVHTAQWMPPRLKNPRVTEGRARRPAKVQFWKQMCQQQKMVLQGTSQSPKPGLAEPLQLSHFHGIWAFPRKKWEQRSVTFVSQTFFAFLDHACSFPSHACNVPNTRSAFLLTPK